MRNLLTIAAAALALSACGKPEHAAQTQPTPRIFDTQRDALGKARQVNDTVQQSAEALRAQEEAQSK